jgi:F-type H+-transporting ATPase subunit b
MAKLTSETHSEVKVQDESIFTSLGLDTQLFVSQAINFAIVFLVVWFLLLKPLTKKLEERREMIDESIDKAKEVETNLMMSEQKYKEMIEEGKREANKIIEKSHADAVVLGDQMKEKSKIEIDGLVTQAKKSIAAEREEALGAVKSQAVEMISAALAKIVSSEMSEKTDKKVIEEALKSMK